MYGFEWINIYEDGEQVRTYFCPTWWTDEDIQEVLDQLSDLYPPGQFEARLEDNSGGMSIGRKGTILS